MKLLNNFHNLLQWPVANIGKGGGNIAISKGIKIFNQIFTTLSLDALKERVDYLLKKVDNLEKIENRVSHIS